VIIHPESSGKPPSSVSTVSFIDYEYATPCPAAFDISNHFAEWGGFSCDYSVLPTRSQRRAFIKEYLASFSRHSMYPVVEETEGSDDSEQTDVSERSSDPDGMDAMERRLFQEVDLFRGVPGLYWGVWALIQVGISHIDFDYGSYAEVRLSEYWAWRAEWDGSRVGEMPEREKRWAEE
jgi:ethanolamine kinase